MKKIITLLISIFSFLFISASPVYAQCPVCTLAVGAGLGLSRYLGIDDMVSGIWAGALVISFSLWFAGWLKKKNYKYINRVKEPILSIISVIFWSFLTYYPLFKIGVIGHPFNVVLGIDKLIFGSIIGGLVFLLAIYTDRKVRKIKGGKLFSFQKVIIPVGFLVITSLLMYLYGGNLK